MTKPKYTYEETRERIHFILSEFFHHELKCFQSGEFDFEFMEFKTDDLLRLMRENGSSYLEDRKE